MDVASRQCRSPLGSSRSDAKANLCTPNPSRRHQVSCSEVFKRLALLCLPTTASQLPFKFTYACSSRHYPTDNRAHEDPPTLDQRRLDQECTSPGCIVSASRFKEQGGTVAPAPRGGAGMTAAAHLRYRAPAIPSLSPASPWEPELTAALCKARGLTRAL